MEHETTISEMPAGLNTSLGVTVLEPSQGGDGTSDRLSSPPLVSLRSPEQIEFEVELQLRDYVDQFGSRVLARCQRFTHNSHDAEDAMQHAFIALAQELRRQLPEGRRIERPLAWLLQVAKRSAIDVVRARKRRRNHERSAAEERPEVPSNEGPVDHENQLAVQQALESLPAKYRTPLILFYFGGQSLNSIAAQLGMTANAVAVKLHRGRAMIGERLKSRGVIVPAVLLPLVLATIVRTQVANRATDLAALGLSSTVGGIFCANSSWTCGYALAASTSPLSIGSGHEFLPAIGTLLAPRFVATIVGVIAFTAMGAGGRGALNVDLIAPVRPLMERLMGRWDFPFRVPTLPRFVLAEPTHDKTHAKSAIEFVSPEVVTARHESKARFNFASSSFTDDRPRGGLFAFDLIASPTLMPAGPTMSRHSAENRIAPNPREQNVVVPPLSPIASARATFTPRAFSFSSRSDGRLEAIPAEPIAIILPEPEATPVESVASTSTNTHPSLDGLVYTAYDSANELTAGSSWSNQTLSTDALLPTDRAFYGQLSGTNPPPVRPNHPPTITPEPSSLLLVFVSALLGRRRR